MASLAAGQLLFSLRRGEERHRASAWQAATVKKGFSRPRVEEGDVKAKK